MNPEAIEQKLHREGYQLTSINKRTMAYVIDEIVVTLLFALIVWDQLSGFKSPEEMMAYTQSMVMYVMAVKVIYQAVFVYMYGATLGKLAMKIRVIEVEYLGLPTLKQAIFRAIMRVVSEMLFYLGFLVAFFSPIRVTWHDRVATTVVVDV